MALRFCLKKGHCDREGLRTMGLAYVTGTLADKNMKRLIHLDAVCLTITHLCQILGPWHTSWQKYHIVRSLGREADHNRWRIEIFNMVFYQGSSTHIYIFDIMYTTKK